MSASRRRLMGGGAHSSSDESGGGCSPGILAVVRCSEDGLREMDRQ